MEEKSWSRGDTFVLEFGHHGVGHISFECKCVGNPQDAPAFIKIIFCEVEKELFEESDSYNGWISKGWIQEEWIHIDILPQLISLPRRYAFRFLKIDVLDTSQNFKIVFHNFIFEKESAVNMNLVPLIKTSDQAIRKIDEVSIRTLQNCMHSVFEDGPKRDRRLWLGDLRLQALVNYSSGRAIQPSLRALRVQ